MPKTLILDTANQWRSTHETKKEAEEWLSVLRDVDGENPVEGYYLFEVASETFVEYHEDVDGHYVSKEEE